MRDMDSMLKDIDDLVNDILHVGKKQNPLNGMAGTSLVNISFNVNVVDLDYLTTYNTKQQKQYQQVEKDIFFDVIDNDKQIKMVSIIPGIRKEEVYFDIKEGLIELEIRKGEKLYFKQIYCKANPKNTSLDSITYNNSVLGIVFNKK
mgnify:CR=1 FL=1